MGYNISKENYEKFFEDFINEKIKPKICQYKVDEEKQTIKKKLNIKNEYESVKLFIKNYLTIKKRTEIILTIEKIFENLKNSFDKNKIINSKKNFNNDENDINIINAIFIEKKLNDLGENDEENENLKTPIKDYAIKLYNDDFDKIENGLDERINKEFKNYFDDDIEPESQEIKNEYDKLFKEFNIIISKNQISQNKNSPKKNFCDDELYEYYDIVFEIDSLVGLKENGWEFKLTEKGKEKYEKKKNNESIVVSVIGNKNKGKSFILSKLSKIIIPDGHNISTKGLSIIYPEYDEKNIICLDTAGFEVPLCEDNKNYVFEIKNGDALKKMEEEKENNKEDEITIKDFLNEDEYITQIEKFIRDRQNTDYFLQKFIIDCADILLCVVNKLNLSDQKFLLRIQKEINNKTIFVIHNLKTFTKIKQVQEYIENTLLRSLTFKLEKSYYTIFQEDKKFLDNKNKEYYIQIFDDDNKNDDNKNDDNKNKKNVRIVHLFMAKVGEKEEENEASNYYNESTLKFIKHNITSNTFSKKFPIKTRVIDFLKSHSGDFFNEPFDNECKLEIKDEILKYEGSKYELKECILDELGVPFFIQSNYLPNHRIYLGEYKSEGEKLFIDIEVSGSVTFETVDFWLDKKNSQNMITIKGKRKIIGQDTNNILAENKLSYLNNSSNLFNLRIFINNNDCIIKKFYKVLDNKGIYTFIFDIVNNNKSDEDNSIEPEIDNEEYEEFEENEKEKKENENINKND